MGEIVNPYIAGAPVTEQRMFFGREDIFQWIENSITGQYADHILVIHGQRRVGKTSVLKQLGNRLPKRYIPVFFDLQGRTHTTLDRFLWWLAREIVRVLKQERGIEVSLPEKEDFARDLEHFENRFLPDLQPALDGSTLLLTFDEFDNLEDSEIKEELGRPWSTTCAG
jgi:AAA+ ATPase superfamily predicted ATPase